MHSSLLLPLCVRFVLIYQRRSHLFLVGAAENERRMRECERRRREAILGGGGGTGACPPPEIF